MYHQNMIIENPSMNESFQYYNQPDFHCVSPSTMADRYSYNRGQHTNYYNDDERYSSTSSACTSPDINQTIPSPTTTTSSLETEAYLDVETIDEEGSGNDKLDYEMISERTLIKKERKKNSNRNKLWKFLLKLLEEDKNEEYIRWTNKSEGEFRMIKTGAVAALWGQSNNRKGMTYEKMTRAMRYYYKMKVIKKVPHKNLHYQFGSCVMTKLIFNELLFHNNKQSSVDNMSNKLDSYTKKSSNSQKDSSIKISNTIKNEKPPKSVLEMSPLKEESHISKQIIDEKTFYNAFYKNTIFNSSNGNTASCKTRIIFPKDLQQFIL